MIQDFRPYTSPFPEIQISKGSVTLKSGAFEPVSLVITPLVFSSPAHREATELGYFLLRKASRMKTFIILLGLLLHAQSTSAEIFKWTDAQGQIHFSDTRPSNKSKDVVDLKSVYDSYEMPETVRGTLEYHDARDIPSLPEKERLRLYRMHKSETGRKIAQISGEIAEIKKNLSVLKEFEAQPYSLQELSDNLNMEETQPGQSTYSVLRLKLRDRKGRLYSLQREEESLSRKYFVPSE